MATAKSSRITAGCLAITNSRDPSADADNGKIVLVDRRAPRGSFVVEGYRFRGAAGGEVSWLVRSLGNLFVCGGESHVAVYYEHELATLGDPTSEVAREIKATL